MMGAFGLPFLYGGNMETIKHFPNESNATERYNNDLLNEIRKTNQLLEQLILLNKPNPTQPRRKKA